MAKLWGSASLHFTPRRWWADHRPYVGRRRRPWGRGQPEASRWRSAARGAAAVPTCLPGREPVSRSRHARSESDGRVAAHSRDPGIAQNPPRPGGTSLSCQATLTESTQPRAKGLPPVGDFFIGPECMEWPWVPGCDRSSPRASATGARIVSAGRKQPAPQPARVAQPGHRKYSAFAVDWSLDPLSLGHFSPILPRFFPIFRRLLRLTPKIPETGTKTPKNGPKRSRNGREKGV